MQTENIRIARKNLSGSNVLAYFAPAALAKKSVLKLELRTVGSGFVNVLSDQKLVLLSSGSSRGGGGALAALDDLVFF